MGGKDQTWELQDRVSSPRSSKTPEANRSAVMRKPCIARGRVGPRGLSGTAAMPPRTIDESCGYQCPRMNLLICIACKHIQVHRCGCTYVGSCSYIYMYNRIRLCTHTVMEGCERFRTQALQVSPVNYTQGLHNCSASV